MKHEADCWIAASAMAAGVSYEEAEKAFGSGADYSSATMGEADEPASRRMAKMFLFLQQYDFFVNLGLYPLFLPGLNPTVKHGRRYLLSAKSYDPKRPWMAHTIVVDENGKVFDPDPNYDATNPKYSIANYPELAGWEIIKWR